VFMPGSVPQDDGRFKVEARICEGV